MQNKLLTADAVAEHFSMSTESIYRLTRQGVLPAVKIGRSYRYDLDTLEAWKAQNSTAGGNK